jgi:tetratricopeptide (TPR) repeat protein
LSCYLAQVRGDLAAAIAIGEEARTRPAENLQWRWGSALMALGTAYRLVGRTNEAAEAFSTVADIGEQTSNAIMAAYALIELGYIHQAHAQLEQAASTFRRIIRVAENGRTSPLTLAALGHLGLGELYREWDDLATSEQHLSKAVVEASRGGLSGSLLWGHAYLALVQQARGEAELAKATLKRGAEYLEDGDAYGAGCIRTIDAMLRLGTGDVDAAASWASSAQPPSPSEVATISVGRRDIEYVAFARVWLAEAAAGRGDRLKLARDLIERMLEPAEATQRTGRVIELLALHAVALDFGGDRQAALHQLARALALGGAASVPAHVSRPWRSHGAAARSVAARFGEWTEPGLRTLTRGRIRWCQQRSRQRHPQPARARCPAPDGPRRLEPAHSRRARRLRRDRQNARQRRLPQARRGESSRSTSARA